MSSKIFISLFIGLASASAMGQTDLQKIISIQQGKIKQLETELKNTGCGSYGSVVYNSVGNLQGPSAVSDRNTRAFWNIPYADRLKVKGELKADLSKNYYNGALYKDVP